MIGTFSDLLKKTWTVLSEAVFSFRTNSDLASASSLAFSAMLALIPALFLLTTFIGMTIGSSQEAFLKVQEMVTQVIPRYSEGVLKEVRYIAAHKGTFGALNSLILVLAVTPLMSDMRRALAAIFRKQPGRPFLLEKLLDLAITIIFLLGITAIAAAGVALSVVERWVPIPELPGYLGGFFQYLFSAAAVFLLYFAFARKVPVLHLLVGALVSAGLWSVMRPLFHLFLAYNPGYGFAFGSFKSLFVVLIWIYYSLAVFLFGAEIAASMGRKEIVFIKKLMEGKGSVPASVMDRYVVRHVKGSVIFQEGDEGTEMYAVRKGSVGILKEGKQIAVIPEGKFFGEMSFLLAAPRTASAVALEDTELVIITDENIINLMNEYPEFVVGALREMARRLRETNKLID
jgi:YihY family inner membrane protein